jgi:hypothetical protein
MFSNRSATATTSIKFFAITALAAIALTGCAPGTSSLIPGPSATPTAEPVFVTAPLTGQKFEETTPEALQLTKPSVACKIDNSEAARPQLGLNSTDIVFDEMVEGGLTRLVAIWQSKQPEAIGPVRSIRPMDPDIIAPFGGIVCFSGGQRRFVDMMAATKVFIASETTEQGKGTYSRATDRYSPHNVIVNINKLASAHPEISAPPVMFDFAADLAGATATTSGTALKKVSAKYPAAIATWVPDTAGTSLLRTQDGKMHTDAADGSQIRATNIVVLNVGVDRSYLDGKYGNVPKTVMVGKGTAVVMSGGKYVKALWSKADKTSRIILTDEAGAAILLAPGNTWVELLPKAPEGKLTIEAVPASPTASPSSTPSATK